MKFKVSLTAGCVCVLLQAMPGYAAQRWTMDSQSSHITFSVRSTLHPVHGTAKKMDGYLNEDGGNLQGRIEVPTDQLDTENIKRDQNMKKMLRMTEYPQIVFNVESVVQADLNQKGQLNGELVLGEKSHKMSFVVDRKQDSKVIQLSGSFPVSLAAYELHPPSVLGVIRVSDRVNVQFDVVFVKLANGQVVP
ncbi:MAG: YceI family protein [Candidatus Omnitrophica bacterium]|nr:YceI family protein [Candidatus Omnitrophota bacterium]